jgi:hypothetical protein
MPPQRIVVYVEIIASSPPLPTLSVSAMSQEPFLRAESLAKMGISMLTGYLQTAVNAAFKAIQTIQTAQTKTAMELTERSTTQFLSRKRAMTPILEP